ncbi:hypothetical protein ASD07_29695 [Duganella sp. Root336D2]|nr:hypothetical protein ASD07_29695 [Duganella sp. Root336D2]
MNELLNGISASVLFREILKSDHTLTGRDLSRMVAEQFPEIDGGAIQLIRRWDGVGRSEGISDADLDIGLTHFLREAGYLIS